MEEKNRISEELHNESKHESDLNERKPMREIRSIASKTSSDGFFVQEVKSSITSLQSALKADIMQLNDIEKENVI